MKLGDKGILNTIGKIVTPSLAGAVHHTGASSLIELSASYLNILIGKGSGTGWDRGEEIVASKILSNTSDEFRTVIDCGGNRGNWTREVRRRLGSDAGRWIIIEPAEDCIRICKNLPNIEVIEAAAGEDQSTLTLYTDGGTSGLASLHRRGDSFAVDRKFTSSEVAVLTIDSIVESRRLDRIDFLKMDIEGHELFALKGASRSLKDKKVRALSFEFGSGNVNSRTFFRDFWDFLVPFGFEIRRICPGGKTLIIKSYNEDLENFRGVTNYLAVLNQ